VVTNEQIRSAEQPEGPEAPTQRACLFTVCGEMLAIDVEHLYEVVQEATITPLPQVPMGLAGVVNFRGEILPVVELAPWLTSNNRCGEETARVMIVQEEGIQVGLRIDEVKDVAEYQALIPAQGEILRPGLELCLKPVAAESFRPVSTAAGRTVWHLLVRELCERLTEIFSTSQVVYERSH
jgi:hypothetical protein